MSLPVHFPQPRYVRSIATDHAIPLEALCARAGVVCQGLGAWTQRPVILVLGEALRIEAMPGYASPVRITLPLPTIDDRRAARLALGALAYGVLDLVARESIRGTLWSRASVPGRPKSARPIKGAERTRRWRAAQQTTPLDATP